jgi:hypothetical protein
MFASSYTLRLSKKQQKFVGGGTSPAKAVVSRRDKYLGASPNLNRTAVA